MKFSFFHVLLSSLRGNSMTSKYILNCEFAFYATPYNYTDKSSWGAFLFALFSVDSFNDTFCDFFFSHASAFTTVCCGFVVCLLPAFHGKGHENENPCECKKQQHFCQPVSLWKLLLSRKIFFQSSLVFLLGTRAALRFLTTVSRD